MTTHWLPWAWIPIVLCLAIITGFSIRHYKYREAMHPYEKKDPLFSATEQFFLRVLEQVVGSEYRVLSKIRLTDIVSPLRSLSKSKQQKALKRIDSKFLDFVLCREHDLSVVCAIELGKNGQEDTGARSRDEVVVAVLDSASIPLVKFPAKKTYDVRDVREQLRRDVAVFKEGTARKGMDNQSKEIPGEGDEKLCPKCRSPMILGKATKGKYAGQIFRSCSRYPECRTLYPIATEDVPEI